jgi:hypothetical protein
LPTKMFTSGSPKAAMHAVPPGSKNSFTISTTIRAVWVGSSASGGHASAARKKHRVP